MTISPKTFAEAEASIATSYENLVHDKKWLHYPMIVSIETFSKCNAACSFCPYPIVSRKGEKLRSSRIISLIDEIAAFPVHPARLNFSRVNEPLLDARLFDFLEYATQKLPTTDLILFSNGQTITEQVIERANTIKTLTNLTISFNEHNADSYKKVMRLDQNKTLPRLRLLHERATEGSLNFRVLLSRVGTSDSRD